MMSCSFAGVRAYRNAARAAGQFKRPLSPELLPSVDSVVLSVDIALPHESTWITYRTHLFGYIFHRAVADY